MWVLCRVLAFDVKNIFKSSTLSRVRTNDLVEIGVPGYLGRLVENYGLSGTRRMKFSVNKLSQGEWREKLLQRYILDPQL